MKRFLSIFLLFLFCLSLSACGDPLDLTGVDGAARVMEISADPEPWLGREILFAGTYVTENFGIDYHYVLLGTDVTETRPGFEIRWEGAYPEPGTAVKVRGILKSVTEFGQKYIYIEVSELHLLHPVE